MFLRFSNSRNIASANYFRVTKPGNGDGHWNHSQSIACRSDHLQFVLLRPSIMGRRKAEKPPPEPKAKGRASKATASKATAQPKVLPSASPVSEEPQKKRSRKGNPEDNPAVGSLPEPARPSSAGVLVSPQET